MSGERTAGVVFQRQFLATVQAFMRSSAVPCFVEDLNAQWGVLFLHDDHLDLAPTQTLIFALSSLLPLLHFYYSEDFRWGYRIFEQGDQRASVEEDFELYYQVADEIAQSRQEPGRVRFDEHDDAILRQSPTYLAAYQTQFAQRHVVAFAAFGLNQESLDHLEALLARADPEHEFEHMDLFRAILGITELSNKSYRRYLHEEQHPQWTGTVSHSVQAALVSGRIVRLS
jgi:hypothetical protein